MFCKGPNIGENKCTDFVKAKASIAECIDDCINNTWFTEKEISKISLLEWRTALIKQTENAIARLKKKQHITNLVQVQ